MQDDIETSGAADHDDARRTAVTAADDTGMLAQHEIVVMDELSEPVSADDADADADAETSGR